MWHVVNLNKFDHNFAVSVLLTVYNQEEYIARAIEGILSQKVNFRFEIVVGDDASTDHSVNVILEFHRRYPEVIVPVLRATNLGGAQNFTDLFRRARGRYLAFVDGDDLWINQEKLQSQYDFLEKNPTVSSVSHSVNVCDADLQVLYIAPNKIFRGNKIQITDFLKGRRFPLTATMVRSMDIDERDRLLDLIDSGPRNAGDMTICLFLLDKGAIPIKDEVMTVYRYRTIAGHENYNSITTLPEKIRDKLKMLDVNEAHFLGKYYFGWLYIRIAVAAVRGLVINRFRQSYELLLLLLIIGWRFFMTTIEYWKVRAKKICSLLFFWF